MCKGVQIASLWLSSNTFNTLGRRLRQSGFTEVQKISSEGHTALDYTTPKSTSSAKTERKELFLLPTQHFLLSQVYKWTEGWLWQLHFDYPSVSFSGKGHQKHKYTVVHKVHRCRTLSSYGLSPLWHLRMNRTRFSSFIWLRSLYPGTFPLGFLTLSRPHSCSSAWYYVNSKNDIWFQEIRKN
jgi:hypothetical protein